MDDARTGGIIGAVKKARRRGGAGGALRGVPIALNGSKGEEGREIADDGVVGGTLDCTGDDGTKGVSGDKGDSVKHH